jgi:hypothetical protein
MSSVTRFIRQVPLSTTYYSAATILTSVAAGNSTFVYEFVPSGSNFVGNYPPGYALPAPAGLRAAINQASNAASSNLLLRDMGKTIFAEVYNAQGTTTSQFAYFRQVQLVNPQAIGASQGFIGGPAGQTFGVLGAPNNPDAPTDYLTFYIPVGVAGVGLPAAATTGAFAIAGGQM